MKTTITRSSGNVFADIGLPNPDEHLVKAELGLGAGDVLLDDALGEAGDPGDLGDRGWIDRADGAATSDALANACADLWAGLGSKFFRPAGRINLLLPIPLRPQPKGDHRDP